MARKQHCKEASMNVFSLSNTQHNNNSLPNNLAFHEEL